LVYKRERVMSPKRRLTKKELKEDKVAEFILQFTKFVQKNLGGVIGVSVGVLIIGIGIYAYLQSRVKANEEASLALLQVQGGYLQGKYNEVIPMFESIVKRYGGTASAKEALVYLGNAHFFLGHYEESKAYFERFLKSHSKNEFLNQAAMEGVGVALEGRGDYLQAAKKYEEVSQKYSKDQFVAIQNLFNAGRCYEAANEFSLARTVYQKIIDLYSDSPRVGEAKASLALLKRE